MIKNIWHTTDEAPKSYEDIAFYVDGYLYSSYYEAQYNQYGIFGADKVEKWCYAKDLSSYILGLETELERTRKALDVAVDKLKGIKAYYDDSYADPHFVNWHIVAQRLANDADDAIKAITALEQKDK